MNNWNWSGSKWWKFDFHNHTPVSDDYGKGADQASSPISFVTQLRNLVRVGRFASISSNTVVPV